MILRRIKTKPTPEAADAASRFNQTTGWYAATARGNRVVITVDPAKAQVLTDAYTAHVAEF